MKFTQLSSLAPEMVVEPRAQTSKLILVIFESVIKECKTSTFIGDIDIFKRMTHAQKIRKKKERETKKSRIINLDYS